MDVILTKQSITGTTQDLFVCYAPRSRHTVNGIRERGGEEGRGSRGRKRIKRGMTEEGGRGWERRGEAATHAASLC